MCLVFLLASQIYCPRLKIFLQQINYLKYTIENARGNCSTSTAARLSMKSVKTKKTNHFTTRRHPSGEAHRSTDGCQLGKHLWALPAEQLSHTYALCSPWQALPGMIQAPATAARASLALMGLRIVCVHSYIHTQLRAKGVAASHPRHS